MSRELDRNSWGDNPYYDGEPSPRERDDEDQRDRWDEGLDPWGYPEVEPEKIEPRPDAES